MQCSASVVLSYFGISVMFLTAARCEIDPVQPGQGYEGSKPTAVRESIRDLEAADSRL